MRQWHEFLARAAAQQTGQIQLVILAPLFTLALLSLLVHTASSAIDPALEKQKVTAQLKRRLGELQDDNFTPPFPVAGSAAPAVLSPPAPAKAGEEPPPVPSVSFFRVDGWQVEEEGTRQYLLHWSASWQEAARAVRWRASFSFAPALFPFLVSRPQRQASLRLSCPPAGRADPIDTAGTQPTSIAGRWLSHGQASRPSGESFAERVLRLVVAFEHGESTPDEAFGTVAGDFDGQGVSFGLLQWNLGRCTLQPLLRAFQRTDPDRFAQSFADGTEVIETLLAAPCEEGVRLARQLLLNKEGRVPDLWVERFWALGHERTFQAVQLAHLRPVIHQAAHLARSLGLQSERAVALCLDIVLQNGGIPGRVRTRYRHDVERATRELGQAPTEVERMLILAHRQAETATPHWVEVVRTRKVTIACGEGRVNGLPYRLDALGITLRTYRPWS